MKWDIKKHVINFKSNSMKFLQKSIFYLSIILLLFSCNKILPDRYIKNETEKKVTNALNCESNGKIINVRINDFVNYNEDYFQFSGVYKGKMLVKYEGEFSGEIVLTNGNVILEKLVYQNSLDKGLISESCLNY